MRAVEQEGWDGNVETFAAFRAHSVGSAHHTGWSRQRRAGCIAKCFARFDYGGLSHNACCADFLDLSAAVGDLPKSICNREVTPALIINFDCIGPNETRI